MPYPTEIPPLLLRLNDWVGQGLLHRSRVKAVYRLKGRDEIIDLGGKVSAGRFPNH